jgi:hypothetical protein
MRFLSLALLATPALLASAAPAYADEVAFGLGVSGRNGAGYVGVRLGEPRPAPVVVSAPPRIYRSEPNDCRVEVIPAHDVVRTEQVVVPAVYEDRRIPIYENRRVPVYETVSRPVFGFAWASRGRGRVQVQIGTRLEQVQVGERVVRTYVGDRVERVLVRAEYVRTVDRVEHVPARSVLVCAHPRRHDHDHVRGPGRRGAIEIMSRAEFRAAMVAARVY